jgi:hypothetical protein
MAVSIYSPSGSENSWYVEILGQVDTTGDAVDEYGHNTTGSWQLDYVNTNNGGGGTRYWYLPAGVYTVRWSGRESNTRLRCFGMDQTATGCSPTPTRTYTPTITATPTETFTITPTVPITPTATWTPNLFCPNPTGSTANNMAGNPICIGRNGPVSLGIPINENNQLEASSVFGMSLTDLKLIADYWGDATGNSPLEILGKWKLSYFEGNLTYGPNQPDPYKRLNAYGVLVVNGDLILNGGNGSDILPSAYRGLVFVTGNLTVRDGSDISGAVIMGRPLAYSGAGQIVLSGSGGNMGTINLDPTLIQEAERIVAQFRENSAARKMLLAIPYL